MKKITYRWKLAGQIFEAQKDSPDEAELRRHIEKLGGELLEIISIQEMPASFTKIEPAPSRAPEPEPSKNLFSSIDAYLEGKSAHPPAMAAFHGWFLLVLGIFLGVVLSFALLFILFSSRDKVDWQLVRYVAMGLATCATFIGGGIGFLSSPDFKGGALFSMACAMTGLALIAFIQGFFIFGLVFLVTAAVVFFVLRRL